MRMLIASLLMVVALPAAAAVAARGRILYQTHCLTCHYERLHERPRERSRVHTLTQLRIEVAERAALTGQRFTVDDLDDIAAYLNASHYSFEK